MSEKLQRRHKLNPLVGKSGINFESQLHERHENKQEKP